MWRQGTNIEDRKRNIYSKVEIKNEKYPKEESAQVLCFRSVTHENFLHNGFERITTANTHMHTMSFKERSLRKELPLGA